MQRQQHQLHQQQQRQQGFATRQTTATTTTTTAATFARGAVRAAAAAAVAGGRCCGGCRGCDCGRGRQCGAGASAGAGSAAFRDSSAEAAGRWGRRWWWGWRCRRPPRNHSSRSRYDRNPPPPSGSTGTCTTTRERRRRRTTTTTTTTTTTASRQVLYMYGVIIVLSCLYWAVFHVWYLRAMERGNSWTMVDKTRYSAAVCVVVKSEEAYLEEWIDYHYTLGFARFYVYDNSPTYDMDGYFDDITDPNDPTYYPPPYVPYRNITTIHPHPGRGVQLRAYERCAKTYGHLHTWLAFLDADEFLVLRRDGAYANVVDFLSAYCPRGALVLNWVTFGMDRSPPTAPPGNATAATGGGGGPNRRHRMYRPLPVSLRFQYRQPAHNDWVKYIARTRDMDTAAPMSSPHRAVLKLRPKHTEQQTKQSPLSLWIRNLVSSIVLRFFPRYGSHDTSFHGASGHLNTHGHGDAALVYHYSYKSRKEYVSKRARGAGTSVHLESRLIDDATRTKGIARDCAVRDGAVWKQLQERVPKYRYYDYNFRSDDDEDEDEDDDKQEQQEQLNEHENRRGSDFPQSKDETLPSKVSANTATPLQSILCTFTNARRRRSDPANDEDGSLSQHHEQQEQEQEDQRQRDSRVWLYGDEYYLQEWVDYHAALGFTRIVVFDTSDDREFVKDGYRIQYPPKRRRRRRLGTNSSNDTARSGDTTALSVVPIPVPSPLPSPSLTPRDTTATTHGDHVIGSSASPLGNNTGRGGGKETIPSRHEQVCIDYVRSEQKNNYVPVEGDRRGRDRTTPMISSSPPPFWIMHLNIDEFLVIREPLNEKRTEQEQQQQHYHSKQRSSLQRRPHQNYVTNLIRQHQNYYNGDGGSPSPPSTAPVHAESIGRNATTSDTTATATGGQVDGATGAMTSLHFRCYAFGTSGERTYKPRPVTQRFRYRVNDDEEGDDENDDSDEGITASDPYRMIRIPSFVSSNGNASSSSDSPLGTHHSGSSRVKHVDVSDAVIHRYRTKSIKESLVRRFGLRRLSTLEIVNGTTTSSISGGRSAWTNEKAVHGTGHNRSRNDGGLTSDEGGWLEIRQFTENLPRGDIHDGSAWDILTTLNPRYSALYEYEKYRYQRRARRKRDKIHDARGDTLASSDTSTFGVHSFLSYFW